MVRMLHGSPAHVGAPFGAQALASWYPASCPATTTWRSSHERCGFSCWLSPAGVRFLGILFSPQDSASLTVGLPCRRGGMDSVGVSAFRTCETRPGWVPSLLRGGGVFPVIVTSMTGACLFSTASPLPR
jgi:hypothetical protein